MQADSRSRTRRGTRLLGGLLALFALTALLVGAPYGLIAFAGNPLPTSIPTTEALGEFFTSPDDGTLFLRVLAITGWIAYLIFAINIVAEILARLTRLRVPALPGRPAAVFLISTIAGMTSAAPALAANAPPVTVATAPAQLDAQPAAAVSTTSPTSATAEKEREPGVWVTVGRGDTLWGYAERHLGDGLRYPEIFNANKDRRQTDGRYLTDPNLIVDGWRLWIPLDEPARQPRSTSSEPDPPAQDELTVCEPDNATHDQQPDEPQTEPAEPSPDNRAPEPDDTEQSRTADQDEDDDTPADQDEQAERVEPAATDPGSDRTHVDDGDPTMPPAVGYSALLAAGIVAILTGLRLRQRRTRKPGHQVPLPPQDSGAAAVEQAMDAAADRAAADPLDRYLRVLATTMAQAACPPPDLTYARHTVDGLELHLAEPPQPILAEPSTWLIPADVLETEPDTTETPSPYPALVTLGHDPDGNPVLIDLLQACELHLAGSIDDAREVLTALTLEISTTPWAADLTVIITGFGAELPAALDGRVTHAATLGEALSASAETSGPAVVLAATEPTTDPDARIEAALTDKPDLAIVAVADQAAGDAWALDLAHHQLHSSTREPVPIKAQRLNATDYRHVLTLLDTAHEPTDPQPMQPAEPSPNGQPVEEPDNHRSTPLPAGDTRDEAAEQPAGPYLRVLGPVELLGATGPHEPTKTNQLTELATYLALNPGATSSAISNALWPDRPVSDRTRNTAMSKLRRWLGTTSDGTDHLPGVGPGGRYILHDVQLDWQHFQAHARGGRPEAALALIRGRPFDGVPARRYHWADPDRYKMISAIADTAHDVAIRHLADHQPAAARQAIAIGLTTEPAAEFLWQDLFQAETLAGDPEALARARRRYLDQCATLGIEPDPETLRSAELDKTVTNRQLRTA